MVIKKIVEEELNLSVPCLRIRAHGQISDTHGVILVGQRCVLKDNKRVYPYSCAFRRSGKLGELACDTCMLANSNMVWYVNDLFRRETDG